MPTSSPDDAALVTAAQAGDRRALEVLLDAYLPFVYTIVRRALDADPDADDVVQETMVRAVRELRGLRDPHTFRAWLGTIAVRQVSTHLQRRRAPRPDGDLDALTGVADVHASFEDLAMLRLGIAAQRRQAARAAQWLETDDRVLLSLWWLEVAGGLTRTELASAAGVSVAHAGVRVQRMRQQLEQCRVFVAALDRRPRCAGLDDVVTGWDGVPASAWRKRLTRHVLACADCAAGSGDLVAAERLLTGLAVLPVPLALAAAVLGKGATAAATSSATLAATKAGVLGHLAKVFAAAPVTATAATGSVVAAATVAVIAWPAAAPPPPPAAAAPPPAATTA
ncbi:RNA polymerase sigma factor, partial [Catellatospora methionotrophica]|uniref:RNA polymerase sigma factor n=1 Tax=Catellatospora methionotrophica TaxID=121620 RepID=UPI0033D8C71A